MFNLPKIENPFKNSSGYFRKRKVMSFTFTVMILSPLPKSVSFNCHKNQSHSTSLHLTRIRFSQINRFCNNALCTDIHLKRKIFLLM